MTGPTNKAAGRFESFFGSTLTPDGTLLRLGERVPEFIRLFRNHFWADENLMAVKCFLCATLKHAAGGLRTRYINKLMTYEKATGLFSHQPPPILIKVYFLDIIFLAITST